MKTAKNLALLFIVIFLSMHSFAVPGNEKKQTRNVKDFHAIKVSTGIDVYIKMGDRESLTIEADDDVIDDVKTELKDGTLHIYKKSRNSLFNWNFNETCKVYVTVKNLDEIDASSGSNVESENTLEGDKLEVEASSGSDVKLDIYYKTVSLKASSGSDARISGKAKTIIAEASSGSDIKAYDLEAAIAKVKASSGSDINISVTDELYARASSGADINYRGNPGIRDTDTSSGGDVNRK